MAYIFFGDFLRPCHTLILPPGGYTRGMDEEAKQLLREIRDLMAASPARYDKAIEENKRVYQEHMAKVRRSAVIVAIILGIVAILLLSYS